MAEPVRARRLTDQEGQRLLQIVRRGKHESVRVRRAMIIMASASGTLVPAIARLVAADEDTVRDVIHAFNAKGLAALDPQWAGGRPRRISDEDIEVIVAAARTRPEKLGQPFTRWSLRKLADYLACRPGGPVTIGRERLRQILHERGVSFQRTRTWKESTDSERDAKLDRIEHVTSAYPDRCFAFGQFGPLSIRPCHGACWARRKHPVRLRATYHRTHGIRYFHGCYCVGDDQLWGVTREHKGAVHTLAALKSIRASRPGGYRLFVIMEYVPRNIFRDQVHVEPCGHRLVDRDEELPELHGAVLAVQFGDDGAVGDVERREQAGHTVPGVVVGTALGHAGHHRQHWLGPVQGLHA
jgi:transposase